MKFADVQKLREAGLITNEQEQRIVDHFKLREDGNRFLITVYLEKKRRKFMKEIKAAEAGKENLP